MYVYIQGFPSNCIEFSEQLVNTTEVTSQNC